MANRSVSFVNRFWWFESIDQVAAFDNEGIRLRLEGDVQMGEPFDEQLKVEARARGCELRVLGRLHCGHAVEFDRLDIVGIGKAWGNKMNYTRREMSIGGYQWTCGITCAVVYRQFAK